ncbi:unnamed protein product [Rotaria sp. Silwood2]|nr:unnamed protein product [Rotaria sp. Silwood2]
MFQPYFMKKKCIPLDIGTNVDPTVFLSDYSTISNANFKDILLATVTTNDFPRNSFTELLNNNEQILTYTRQLTILMNKLNYYKLQQEQWTYYYQLGITEGIWNGRVSKAMAQMNSMCHTYGRSKVIVNQRREKYQKQLEQTENELHEYMKQAPTHVDINQLTTIVTHFIHQDQYSLRIEMERRRQMLKWNAEDHRLIEIFYKLEPRQTEIHSATVIWKATSAEQTLRSEIEIFKTWVSSRSSLAFYTYRDLGLTTINEILTQLVFDQQCVITNLNKYIDDVFFTCNQSEDKVKEILDAANNFHPNIELEYKIGKCAPFLDVYVENNNGNFVSSVYHKPSTESTVLSFLYDHPRHVFRNVIQTSLNRAIRYSSTFDIFNHERRAIRLMLLYNR